MPRIRVPKTEEALAAGGGWTVYRYYVGPNSESVMWPRFKLIHTAALKRRRKRGVHRVAHLSWGIEAGRLSRTGALGFMMQHYPEAVAALEKYCRQHMTLEAVRERLGPRGLEDALRIERDRIAAQRARQAAKYGDPEKPVVLTEEEWKREQAERSAIAYAKAEDEARIENRRRECERIAAKLARAWGATRVLKKMERDRERYERAEEEARIEHRARELKAAAKAAGRAVTVDDLM